MNTILIQVENDGLVNFELYLSLAPHSINSTEEFIKKHPFKVLQIFDATLWNTHSIVSIPTNEVTCLCHLDLLTLGYDWPSLGTN